MKKISFIDRERNKCLLKKRWVRELRSREKRRAQRRPKQPLAQYVEYRALSTTGRERFIVPEKFSLETNPDAVLELLHSIRTRIPNIKNFHLDFEKLRHIGPCAALLLVAEMDRLRHFTSRKTRRQESNRKTRRRESSRNTRRREYFIEPDNFDPEVLQQLDEMGLFDVLDIDNPAHVDNGNLATASTVSFIKYRSKRKTIGQMANELMNDIESLVGELPQREKLYNAISEAMTNVSHHAYPHPVESPDYERVPLKGRWWLSGGYDHAAEKLTVMFVDQGIGIPKTLPTNRGMEWLKSRITAWGIDDTDASRIKASMEPGKSVTKESHRGHGLFRDIREYINVVEEGRLRVVSNKGEYRYAKSLGQESREDLISLSKSIGGTLILWEWKVSREVAA